jgi:nucleotide-binding universal stress UspA family protein
MKAMTQFYAQAPAEVRSLRQSVLVSSEVAGPPVGIGELRLAIVACDAQQSRAVLSYGRQIARLLGVEPALQKAADFEAVSRDYLAGCDLAILGEPRQSLWQRFWPGLAASRAAVQWSCSLLLARRPRWPLHRILTLVRGDDGDEAALDWTSRLAAASGAGVTLLPIIPSLPGLYNQGNQVQAPPHLLLLAHSMTGRCLRRQLRRLHQAGIDVRLASQPGVPADQIEAELCCSAPDLVVIAAETCGQLLRLWLGELVGPLLRTIDRPLLIARQGAGIGG